MPLAIALTVLDVSTGGTPAEGAAVYLWHCDRDGRYSMYYSEIADQNYLRGVQVADAAPTCPPMTPPTVRMTVFTPIATPVTSGGTASMMSLASIA